jgi:membrane protease subunit HflK
MSKQNENLLLPALEKFLRDIFLLVIPLFILIGFLSSGYYTVQPDEEAVVLRFGKFHQTAGPGLHFKIPFGVDQVKKVKVSKVHTLQFGTAKYEVDEELDKGLTLTGDLNIADVQWIIQYRIKDAVKYLFNVSDITKTLSNVSDTIMSQEIGDRSIDAVINIERQEIEFTVQGKMQEILDSYNMGIQIALVKLQNVTPPRPVAPAFNEVNEANQEKEQMINQALAEYNKTIPRVEGEAQQIISQAEGYAIDKVNRSKGDIAKFKALLTEYQKAKDITKVRIYLETMEKVHQNAEKIIIDEDLRGVLPLLELQSRTK